MKKKIIISLILAMCCIVASIPASANCDTCGGSDLIFAWCRSTGEMGQSSHRIYDNSPAGSTPCYYEIRVYEEGEFCDDCDTVTYGRRHGHGEYSHSHCGAANSEGCSLGHNNY